MNKTEMHKDGKVKYVREAQKELLLKEGWTIAKEAPSVTEAPTVDLAPAPAPTVAPALETAPAPTDAPKEGEAGMLLGSSIQPSNFNSEDGEKYTLGEVVAEAFTASGLTEKEWNARSNDELGKECENEKAIAAVIDAYGLKDAEAAQVA